MTHVLLNNVDHHDLRVITATRADRDAHVNQVLVFPTEFEKVQREYPILIRKDSDGKLRPIAMLGLSRGENLFVDGEGRWQAHYMPALLQRGPFSIAAPDSAEGEPMIRIDLDHPRVSRSEGASIFLPHGGNSPYLEQISALLRTIYVGHQQLDPMVAQFETLGLLRPINLEVRVSEDGGHALSDVFTIDRERLAALGEQELAALHSAGFLEAAFMIAASIGNMLRLANLKAGRASEDRA